MKQLFETGASTHAVNDLILFTDNTRELAELRDSIYKEYQSKNWQLFPHSILPLFTAAVRQYVLEFKHDADSYKHISNMRPAEVDEFCVIYMEEFDNWKAEHNL
jgi:hypothetical protein